MADLIKTSIAHPQATLIENALNSFMTEVPVK